MKLFKHPLKIPGLQDVPYSSLYSSPINKADSVFDNQYSEPKSSAFTRVGTPRMVFNKTVVFPNRL